MLETLELLPPTSFMGKIPVLEKEGVEALGEQRASPPWGLDSGPDLGHYKAHIVCGGVGAFFLSRVLAAG